jgi:threonine dehydrogenase-like Zn-dependent dehydrogenase
MDAERGAGAEPSPRWLAALPLDVIITTRRVEICGSDF